jgi:dTDP-4-amino-4,6-dideoxygalactose transaminase
MQLGVPVIEDCAHCLGIEIDGQPVGSVASIAISSFYATKLLGTGQGGVVLVNDEMAIETLEGMLNYSDRHPDGRRLNDRMSDLEAGLLLSRLDRLSEFLEARQRLADLYLTGLADLQSAGRLRLPTTNGERIWYRFAVENLTQWDSRLLRDDLLREGIKVEEPIWDWRDATVGRKHPIANRAYARLLSLPIYPDLSSEEINAVLRAIDAVLGR